VQDVFDWIVIGSGPAGQRAAVQAAKLKKKTLIVEREDWGGGCVHKGTIPSKTLKEAALNNDARLDNAWEKIRLRKDRVLRNEAEIIARQLDRNGVSRVRGEASFEEPHVIRVGDSLYQGSKFLVATGTRPCHSADFPWDLPDLYDSDSILEMKESPEALLVLGAGVIGCEYASIFARLGVDVALVDRRKELLRNVDQEIVESLRIHFSEMKIRVELGVDFSRLRQGPAGRGVELEIDGHLRRFSAALVCLGRQGNVEALGLKNLGVVVSDRGIITVNRDYQTNLSHIYAAGDVIGPPALAASSAEQGRIAARHAFGQQSEPFSDLFPYGIYTIPEISSVGAQESELQKAQKDYVVGRARYSELARGQILGDEHGLLKILVSREDGRVLGVHILGTGATELIHIGQTAMHFQAKVDFFVSNIFNYPTLAEAYKVAALNALNQL
jgi:NAD(P) transhydrogenase